MAGRAQQNFKVDVNRTKTQRWVDAKQASYGGDEWGGYDDYDDILEEEEDHSSAAPSAQQQPAPKVTGLRQRGQASVRDAETASSRPSSKPTSPEVQQQPTFQRRPSFEQGDDRRDLSGVSNASGSARSSTQNPAAEIAKQQQQQQQQQRRSPAPPQGSFPGPEQRRSPQPQFDADRRLSPPPQGVSRPPDGRVYPPLQTEIPPAGGRPDKGSPGQGRHYANGAGAGPGPGPANDNYQRRDFPPQSLRDKASQEFKNGKDPRGPPPPRDPRGPPPRDPRDYDHRGPPPRDPRDYRGPPPRDPRDYRGPPPRDPRDPRGPPPHDPRYRAGPPYDPRGPPPPRDYRGPPHDYRGPPPPGYRGDPRGPPQGRPRKDSRGQPPMQFGPSELPAEDVVVSPEPTEPEESTPAVHVGSETSVPVMAAAAVAAEPTSPPPPIVRPADIYKRVSEEQERERQSLDSVRPSTEGRSSQENRPSTDSAGAGATARLAPNLTPVAERRSEYGMDGMPISEPVAMTAAAAGAAPQNKLELPMLPSFDRFSGFGLDMGWNGAGPTEAAAGASAVPGQEPKSTPALTTLNASGATETPAKDAGLQHQPSLGFRTAVNDAFEEQNAAAGLQNYGSVRSQATSDMSRSNTDSTSGISPIMSRVPSAATAELKAAEKSGRPRQPSLIAEEPVTSNSRPNSSDTLKASLLSSQQDRVVSIGSTSTSTTRQFSSPETTEGPAHTAAVSSRKTVKHSHEGQIAAASPTSPNMSDMSRRESDLAGAASEQQETRSPEIGNEEKDAQAAFISTHKTVPPIATQQIAQADASMAARSASPSKGRVHQLANKFNDINDKASPTSSISSWNSSANNSRENIGEPEVTAKKSKTAQTLQPPRPQPPGGWVSEASDVSGRTSTETQEESLAPGKPRGRDASPADPRPSTAKQQLSGQEFEIAGQNGDGSSFEHHAEGAMAQLAASGNSLAKNLAAAMAKRTSPSPNPEEAERHQRFVSNASAADSKSLAAPALSLTAKEASAAGKPNSPLSKAKDSPYDRDGAPQRQSGYFPSAGDPPPLRISNPDASPKSPEQKSALSEVSIESSGEDTENDRLRKEIMKDLSPPSTAKGLTPVAGLGLAPIGNDASRGTSASTLPHEYNDYWDRSPSVQEPKALNDPKESKPSAVNVPTSPASPPTSKSPNYLQSRFSWEDGTEASVLPSPGVENASRAPLDLVASSSPRASEDRASSSGPLELDAGASPRESLPPIDTSELQRLNHDSKIQDLRSVSPTPEYDDEDDDVSLPSHADIPPRGDSAVPPRLDSAAIPPRYDSAMAQRTETPTDVKPSPMSPLTKGPISSLIIPDFKKPASAGSSTARTMAFKSSAAEISGMDTGLNDWLAYMVSTHPELNASAFTSGMRPSTAGTGTVKAKHPPAVVENFGQASQDLMHVAGKLGGKASQSAKGLFAKGRSRFRRGSVEKTE